MTAMLSGVIVVAAFGLLAALGLVLAVALYRISGGPASAGDSDLGRSGPEGS
jgi:hypothetical protein